MFELGRTPANPNYGPVLQSAAVELTEAIESGVWPREFFSLLLDPVERWGQEHATDYHHTGYTFPDKAAFEAATAQAPGDLIANNLSTSQATHQRRYLTKPDSNSGPATFIEYHMVGEKGNGVRGIHVDVITDDAAAMLAYVEEAVGMAKGPNAKLVTQPFGGGNAPVGKVELQPTDDPTLAVGVMVRTHWSHPADW